MKEQNKKITQDNKTLNRTPHPLPSLTIVSHGDDTRATHWQTAYEKRSDRNLLVAIDRNKSNFVDKTIQKVLKENKSKKPVSLVLCSAGGGGKVTLLLKN